jgi:tRNA C32,U32 (ribose-2'-O)-methylase TrmJ
MTDYRLLLEKLMTAWKENHGGNARTLAATGVRAVILFQPEEITSMDEDMIMTMAFAVMTAIQNQIDGALPTECFDAVMHGITGAYGLGVRAGLGNAFVTVAREAGKLSKDYISHKTGETLPSEALLAAYEARTHQTQDGNAHLPI